MARMKETRTIFLAADGRHTIIGQGDAIEMPGPLAETILGSGLEGWLAIMAGDYHGHEAVHLARVHAVFPTADDKWPRAVDRFMAARDRSRGCPK